MKKQPRKKLRKKPEYLQPGSLPTQLLASIASGALSVSAIFVGAAASGSRLKSQRRWLYRFADDLDRHTKSDIERMLIDAKRRRQVTTALDRLKRRRLVNVVRRGAKEVLVVSEAGKQKLVPVLLAATEAIAVPDVWDKRWRVVLYDIPETRRSGRDALRERLQYLGFFQLQKSAFVFPYPCTDELDAVVHAFDLHTYTTIFTAQDLGYHESRALEYFRLLPEARRT